MQERSSKISPISRKSLKRNLIYFVRVLFAQSFDSQCFLRKSRRPFFRLEQSLIESITIVFMKCCKTTIIRVNSSTPGTLNSNGNLLSIDCVEFSFPQISWKISFHQFIYNIVEPSCFL